ncbi:hypothetical protein D3C73_784730 [compost metagenome]
MSKCLDRAESASRQFSGNFLVSGAVTACRGLCQCLLGGQVLLRRKGIGQAEVDQLVLEVGVGHGGAVVEQVVIALGDFPQFLYGTDGITVLDRAFRQFQFIAEGVDRAFHFQPHQEPVHVAGGNDWALGQRERIAETVSGDRGC